MVLHTLTYSIFRFVVSQFTLCIYQSCANLKVSQEYCKRYSSISVKDNEMRKCWRKSEFWGICSGYTCKRCLIKLWTVWQIFRELVWLIDLTKKEKKENMLDYTANNWCKNLVSCRASPWKINFVLLWFEWALRRNNWQPLLWYSWTSPPTRRDRSTAWGRLKTNWLRPLKRFRSCYLFEWSDNLKTRWSFL